MGNPRSLVSRRALAFLAALLALATVAQADAAVRVREKTANLDIAKRVAERLRTEGLTVRMTRTSDRTLRPASRTRLPNRIGADAFVSIHNNGSRYRSARGTEIYRSIRRDGSKALGNSIWRTFRETFGPERRNLVRTRRGCCGDYYYQLRRTRMPAVLVEGAYVTNPSEGRKLGSSSTFRQRIADAIAEGILAWQASIGGRPPSPDPGITAPAPLPPPIDLAARELRSGRVELRWTASGSAEAYRVYRDGRLIAIRKAPRIGPTDRRAIRWVDRWASPGQSYTYLVRPARELEDLITGEGAPAITSVETDPITVVLDAGHGGRDPGAIARY